MYASDPPVGDFETSGCGIGEGAQHPACPGAFYHVVHYIRRTRRHQTGIGIPHRTTDRCFVEQWKLLFCFLWRDQTHVGAKGFAGSDFALQLLPQHVVISTADFHSATFGEKTVVFVELAAERGSPVIKLVVSGVEDEVGRMIGRSHVGRDDARLLDTDDVAHAKLSEKVRKRCANDAANTDDYYLGAVGKILTAVHILCLG